MKEELEITIQVLKNKGVIVYPTDTIWGVGCDSTALSAIEKIKKIKERAEEKSFILLVDSIQMLENYVDVPSLAYDLIDYTFYPLTIIYDKAKNLPNELMAKDGSIAIRVTKDPFCKDLIKKIQAPIVSTSANISGQKSPTCFKDIATTILQQADHVVNWRRNEKSGQASKIIRLSSNGNIKIIR